jgi:hypothetical protein
VIFTLAIDSFIAANPEVAKWIIGSLLAVLGTTVAIIWEVVYHRLGGLSKKIDEAIEQAREDAVANAEAHGEIMAEVALVKGQSKSISERIPNGEIQQILTLLRKISQ